MTHKEDCIFCKIVMGIIPASTIYEDASVLSFLDINPAMKGHALVIPKNHFDDTAHTPSFVLGHMMEVAKKVGDAQSKTLGSSGYNLLINTGKDAGQVVFHTHLHVIPRWADDGLKIEWTHKKYADGEMQDHREKLKALLGGH